VLCLFSWDDLEDAVLEEIANALCCGMAPRLEVLDLGSFDSLAGEGALRAIGRVVGGDAPCSRTLYHLRLDWGGDMRALSEALVRPTAARLRMLDFTSESCETHALEALVPVLAGPAGSDLEDLYIAHPSEEGVQALVEALEGGACPRLRKIPGIPRDDTPPDLMDRLVVQMHSRETQWTT
jgi:hypothetical protein